MERQALNVLGKPLKPCSMDPLTGFQRNGCCHSCHEDRGLHVVCARVTREFLLFSKSKGNDLISPAPEYHFPGLKEGDMWCICLSRWTQAFDVGVAPPIDLEATHISVLDWVTLEQLKENSIEAIANQSTTR